LLRNAVGLLDEVLQNCTSPSAPSAEIHAS
jgi:hypothetical protein